jgi:hypothetical protein
MWILEWNTPEASPASRNDHGGARWVAQESGELVIRPTGIRISDPDDEQLGVLTETSQTDGEIVGDLRPLGAGAPCVRERAPVPDSGGADRGDQRDTALTGRLAGELEGQLVVVGAAESGEDRTWRRGGGPRTGAARGHDDDRTPGVVQQTGHGAIAGRVGAVPS